MGFLCVCKLCQDFLSCQSRLGFVGCCYLEQCLAQVILTEMISVKSISSSSREEFEGAIIVHDPKKILKVSLLSQFFGGGGILIKYLGAFMGGWF